MEYSIYLNQGNENPGVNEKTITVNEKTKTSILAAFGRIAVVAAIMMLMPSCSDGNVKISEANFPDESFRAWLLEQDYGQDGQLTEQEIAGIERMDVCEKGIGSLKGIEFFTALKDLRCYGNKLTELDLTQCHGLETLMCESNMLTELDLSGCPALSHLSCTNNQLTGLDLSQCTELSHLQCEQNKLEVLNVSGCTALAALICYDNQLSRLELPTNPENLSIFQCQNNKLDRLDVSQCPLLRQLDCQKNQLTAINLQGCKKLTHIDCSDNQLTELDPSASTTLYYLNCACNRLTGLDLAPFAELNYLVCANNQIGSEAMDALVTSLCKGDDEQVHPSTLCLFSEDEGEKNVCTRQFLAKAKAKRWKLRCIKDGKEKDYEPKINENKTIQNKEKKKKEVLMNKL